MSAAKGPVALLCSEPLRARMAGVGIRYLEMARRLPGLGVPVRLIAPFLCEADRQGVRATLPDEVAVESHGSEPLAELVAGSRAVLAQGQIANDVIHGGIDLPLVIDLYDPWLVENLHYVETLGLDPYRNDHASWMLQLSAGDLFLCSSEEQRLFYLGLLVAAGRVHPRAVAADPALERLLRIVPFGVPRSVPEHRPLLEPRGSDELRILFGGLYDWYDPWPLLRGFADAVASGRDGWRLLIVHNPGSDAPQRLVEEVRRWARRQGLERHVLFQDWVPAERRYDLLRDVDVLAATHRHSLETMLSLRTRFLDALAVGCPILVTEGGTISRRLAEAGGGWVVAEGDAGEVRAALEQIADDPAERDRRVRAAGTLAEEHAWEKVLEPLADYLRAPWRDPSRTEFATRLPTRAPSDPLGFRVRRRLRRALGSSGGRP